MKKKINNSKTIQIYKDDSIKKFEANIQILKNENIELNKKIKIYEDENMNVHMEIASLKIENATLKLENEKYKDNEVIQKLENEIHKLNFENKRLYQELKEVRKEKGIHIKNERGAGRKPTIKNDKKTEIRIARKEGKTIKEISDHYGISVGSVHKIINE